MNYLQKKKLAFMSIVNRVKGFIRTITGTLPLTLANCVDEESIIDYTLYGQSVQNGTPTPETPIEVESVGEYDEETGKYKIPITVSDGTRNITTNIYLDEPLRKVGDYADYIDLENGKVVRNVGNKIFNGTENWIIATSWGHHAFYIPNQTNMISWGTSLGALSTHFKTYTGLSVTTLINEWVIGGSNMVFANENYTDTISFKSWLSENNVEVLYPLKESIEEDITLPNLPTFKGTSILNADTTIQPSNAEVTYYSNVKE